MTVKSKSFDKKGRIEKGFRKRISKKEREKSKMKETKINVCLKNK
jgi:hypothetical protein